MLSAITRRMFAPAPAAVPHADLAKDLQPLPEPFRGRLMAMYRQEPQLGADNLPHGIDQTTRISPEQGMWIYNLCREVKPVETLEIGLAYGFSTLYFLAAQDGGHHTAVDPFQTPHWHGIGRKHGEGSGRFTWVEDRSFPALVKLNRPDYRPEIIFIDGGHRFDDVIVDFTLAAEICPVGGYILLDDMWMNSIYRVAEFIRRNRTDFSEVSTPITNLCAFRRTGDDSRNWDHFVKF